MPVEDTDYNPKHSSLHSGILCSLVILTHLGKKLSMQIVPHKNLEKLWEHSRRKGWRCFFTSLFQLQLMETLSSWPKKRDLRAQWEAAAVWEQVARRSTLSLSCSLCPSALPAQWLQSSAFPGALLCRIPSPVPCSACSTPLRNEAILSALPPQQTASVSQSIFSSQATNITEYHSLLLLLPRAKDFASYLII